MTRRIRVLTLVSGLAIGEPLGGAERFGVELACALDRDRFEPVVCGFWRRGVPAESHWLDYLGNAGVEAFFAVDRGRGFDPAKYRHGLRSILGHLGSKKVDIIHSHFQLGSITALLIKGALQAKAVIRTAHGSVRWEWRDTWHGFLCRQIFTNWIFPLGFDAEVGVSQAVVSSLDRRPGARLVGKQAFLLYNGIRLSQFAEGSPTSDPRQELGLTSAHLIVGSVGRLSLQKGYKYLIEAAPMVIAARPNVRFVLIGDGELREQLRYQVDQLGLSHTIIFAGARQNIASWLRIMDLFVLPSLWEGLPTVVLESMICGVPVVATNISGTQELIHNGQTGWLVQPRDPAGLATAILYALNNPAERKQVALRALDRIVPRYSIEQIADQYEALYQWLVGQDRMISGPGCRVLAAN